MTQARGETREIDFSTASWAKDSKSVVIAQGGRIRRLDVTSGRVTTIPFTARVHRSISEMADSPLQIADGPLAVKFPRWASASPDGQRLIFQAVGRIWLMDLPDGTPRRLTPDSFEPLEMSPAWSPDGRWIAFTSWADQDLGRVWRIPAAGGQPQRVTTEAAEYLNTLWSPDGQEIVAVRGSGATLRGRTVSNNLWYELVRVPAAGGNAISIVTVNRPYTAGRPMRRQSRPMASGWRFRKATTRTCCRFLSWARVSCPPGLTSARAGCL